MSVLLAVLGMLAVTMLTSGVIDKETSRLTATEEKLDTIQEAIQIYYNQNGHLPCPTSASVAADTAGFGLATDCAAAAPAGTTDVNLGGNDDLRIGVIPTRTLLLPDADMFDAWGNRFGFTVIKKLATTDTDFSGYITDNMLTTGVILIKDSDGAQATQADEKHINAYALVSYGADKRGSYSKAGSQGPACDATQLDSVNCTADEVFLDAPVDENTDSADANPAFAGTTSPYFYDLLRYTGTLEIIAESGE